MVASITIAGTIGTPDERLSELLEGTGAGQYFGASELRAFLEGEAKDATEIEITIDSPGGDVAEGFEMYDALKAVSATKQVTTIAKRADSIASVIFLAGNVRKIVKGASYHIHNAWISPVDLNPDLMLNSTTLERIKQVNEMADGQILAVYAEVAGRANAEKIANLMRNETSLTEAQLIELNFATEIIKGEVSKALRPVAFNSELLKIDNEMSDERISGIEKALRALKALVMGNTKAMSVQLADGAQIFVYSEDGEFEGKRAVMMEDGEPTESPAPEGTHALQDGREIVVGADGVIQEVKEASVGMSEEEMNSLIAQKEEEMKAAMEEEKKQMAASYEEKENALRAEFSEKLEAVTTELAALKNEVPGDKGKPKAKAEKVDFAKLKPSERALMNIKANLRNSTTK